MRTRALLPLLFLSSLAFSQPGYITTIAGTGVAGFSGDNGPGASAQVNAPNGVVTDRNGNIYIADYANNRIRRIDPNGTIRTVAGCGSVSVTCVNQNTMRPATDTLIFGPWDVAVDLSGFFYFPNSGNNHIQQVVNTTGIIWEFAGTGVGGSSSAGFSGDGGQAVLAKLNNPVGVTFDNQGNLFFADLNNQRIRKITPQGIISTVAGNGTAGFSGDGGLAINARLNAPHGVTIDSAGNLYIADTTNYRIRKVTPAGIISTVAGIGSPTFGNNLGDGGPALNSTFVPWDVDVDTAGNLYIADWLGHRIRKIDAATQVITTIAGNGVAGFAGDNGPAANSQVNAPTGIHVDSQGNVYFADNLNHRIRKINAPPLGPPSIRSTNPVVPSFMGNAGFSSNMYVEIYGTNFSRVSRVWGSSDFNGANAPTSMEGVSVTINNKPAFIYYVSPTQINVNVPDDTATGPVEVRVTTFSGTSTTTVPRSRLSPTLQTVPQFLIGGKQYVVALTPNFVSYIGRPNMLAGLSFVAPKPGDTISIFALGLGPTVPTTQAGVTTAANSDVALPLQVKIGDVQANVSFKGMLQGTIGLYQLNVVMPNLAPGDHKMELTVDGVKNQQDLYVVLGQ